MAHVSPSLACDGLAGIVEVVALGFAGDGGADGICHHGIIGAGPQRRAQVGHVFLAQAHVQLTGAGQADPVAAFAEIVGQGGDQADPLARLIQPDVTGRAAGAIGQVGHGVAGGKAGAQVGQAPVLVQTLRLAHVAHRHDLDKSQVMPVAGAPFGEGEKFILVETFQGDGVDLDLEPRLPSRGDPVQHLRQTAPAGDFGEFLVVKGIDGNVDPFDAQSGEIAGVFAQLRAVGRQGQFFQRATGQMPRHRLEKRENTFANQGFAAGDPQLFNAKADEGGAEAVEFLQSQQFGLGQKGHVFGHAIGATEIAAVGDRDTQVGDGAGKGVDEGVHGGKSRARAGWWKVWMRVSLNKAPSLGASSPRQRHCHGRWRGSAMNGRRCRRQRSGASPRTPGIFLDRKWKRRSVSVTDF